MFLVANIVVFLQTTNFFLVFFMKKSKKSLYFDNKPDKGCLFLEYIDDQQSEISRQYTTMRCLSIF